MSISDLIMYIVWLYLCWVLISRTIESVKRNNYERKIKKAEKERKKAFDNYYKQRNHIKSQEKIEEINDIEVFDNTDEVDDTDLKNFIAEVNDAWFEIDEEDALEYISDWRSPEDYVTYMEEFYQWDDN